jgi:hypothetical protein
LQNLDFIAGANPKLFHPLDFLGKAGNLIDGCPGTGAKQTERNDFRHNGFGTFIAGWFAGGWEHRRRGSHNGHTPLANFTGKPAETRVTGIFNPTLARGASASGYFP